MEKPSVLTSPRLTKNSDEIEVVRLELFKLKNDQVIKRNMRVGRSPLKQSTASTFS